MRRHVVAGLIGALLGLVFISAGPAALAQDSTTKALAVQPTPEETLLSDADLDTLLGPVALFPDTLLTQILLAATYPLDVVKAGRFVDANAETSGKERAALVEKTAWDPSVQALAAGFPTVVTRMNDNIDWTEQVGEALLAQPDDVLDAVQRLRNQAAETGYLTTNDAQTVTVNANDTITIAPTDPQIVYVPAYDPNVVYAQAAPATGVVFVDSGKGSDFGNALATGAIVFGTAMILNEIFDTNDPWDHYWRGPPRLDWNNNDFDARPNVNVDGNLNIGNTINRNNVNIDRDRIDLDRTRIGNLDHDGIDRNRDRNFRPGAGQRDAARDKITARKAAGGNVATLPATTRAGLDGSGDAATRPAAAARPAPARVNKPVALNRPVKVDRPAATHLPQNVSRPAAASRPSANRTPNRSSAFEKSGGSRAKAASSRGRASAGSRRQR